MWRSSRSLYAVDCAGQATRHTALLLALLTYVNFKQKAVESLLHRPQSTKFNQWVVFPDTAKCVDSETQDLIISLTQVTGIGLAVTTLMCVCVTRVTTNKNNLPQYRTLI